MKFNVGISSEQYPAITEAMECVEGLEKRPEVREVSQKIIRITSDADFPEFEEPMNPRIWKKLTGSEMPRGVRGLGDWYISASRGVINRHKRDVVMYLAVQRLCQNLDKDLPYWEYDTFCRDLVYNIDTLNKKEGPFWAVFSKGRPGSSLGYSIL